MWLRLDTLEAVDHLCALVASTLVLGQSSYACGYLGSKNFSDVFCGYRRIFDNVMEDGALHT